MINDQIQEVNSFSKLHGNYVMDEEEEDVFRYFPGQGPQKDKPVPIPSDFWNDTSADDLDANQMRTIQYDLGERRFVGSTLHKRNSLFFTYFLERKRKLHERFLTLKFVRRWETRVTNRTIA